MKVREVAGAIEEFAPLGLQESYDNSGLNVGSPDAEVSGVLICVDVTDEVVDEALAGAERAFYDSTNVAFAKGSIFGRGGGGTPVQTAADRMDVRAGGLEGRAEGVARRRGPEPAGL